MTYNKRYKVYLRDWYYNAGIVGFLNVLSEGKMNIEEIKQDFSDNLTIEDNYLEFDSNILSNFYEKYKKLAFDMFFDIDSYKEKIEKLINKIHDSSAKINKKMLQETALNGKIVNCFIKTIYGKDLNELFAGNNILVEVEDVKNILNGFNSNLNVYEYLLDNNGDDFIAYFLNYEVTKRICSYEKIPKYLDQLNKNKSDTLLIKNDQKCYICGKLKKEYDIDNAITQILGFNTDNSNWIWGFQPSKTKICSLCALIYSCALHGMVFLNRKVDKRYKTFFYTLNRNSDIFTLYNSFWIFKEKINQKENQNKPFYTILQEVTLELVRRQAQAVIENINFIEIEENQFGGQSTKAYNIYNYNITKNLAEFIQTIGETGVPKGFYIDRDIYLDVGEEILKKTLEQTLGFSDLSRYFEYFIRSFETKSKNTAKFSISKITRYIIKYINKTKGGDVMAPEQIINKAFFNGKTLGEKIGQDNKIKGIAYQLLNDLKISDRNSFLDKYLRLSMAYGSEIKLGSNEELTNIDNFMSFGYAFVNGLLSNIKTQGEVNNG